MRAIIDNGFDLIMGMLGSNLMFMKALLIVIDIIAFCIFRSKYNAICYDNNNDESNENDENNKNINRNININKNRNKNKRLANNWSLRLSLSRIGFVTTLLRLLIYATMDNKSCVILHFVSLFIFAGYYFFAGNEHDDFNDFCRIVLWLVAVIGAISCFDGRAVLTILFATGLETLVGIDGMLGEYKNSNRKKKTRMKLYTPDEEADELDKLTDTEGKKLLVYMLIWILWMLYAFVRKDPIMGAERIIGIFALGWCIEKESGVLEDIDEEDIAEDDGDLL